MEEGGIYIHVPYCKSKCLYCDFYSGGIRIADWGKFITAILNELSFREKELIFEPISLYIGGGTPSLMEPLYLKKLIDGIKEKTFKKIWQEFTLEVNPEDVTKENCEVWKDIGVNRISLGLQTLDDIILKIIGRKHDSKRALEALELLKNYFNNVSVDLIFGLPSQTLKDYDSSLCKILDFKPQHISSYSLMLEHGTSLTLLESQGKVNLPSEEEWINMFRLTIERFKEEGYNHYEISNYSLPGYHSIHNSNYWLGKPYLGLGPSAHSYNGMKVRRANHKDINGYINNYLSDPPLNDSFFGEEILTEEERREEMIMTRLRTAKGLNLEEFTTIFGENKKRKLLHQASQLIQQGWIKEISGFLSFTEKGILISDSILSKLI